MVDTGSGGGVETGGRSHHHGLALVVELLQAPATEFLRIVNREFRHRVEGAHGDGGIDAGDAVQTVDEAFAALHVLVINIAEILFGGVQGGLRHNLSYQWG